MLKIESRYQKSQTIKFTQLNKINLGIGKVKRLRRLNVK